MRCQRAALIPSRPRWGLRVPRLLCSQLIPSWPHASARGSERAGSPHAICAALRAEGRTVSAETIYRAAYDHSGSSGLPEGSWRCLPRRRRRRKPRGRCTTRPSPLGDFRPVCERPADAGDRSEAGHWEGDPIIGAGNRPRGRDPRRAAQPPDPHSGPSRRLRRPQDRSRRGWRSQPPAPTHGQDPDLGPGTRDGPLATRRKRHRREGVLL